MGKGKSSGKGSLKGALQSQQHRLKKKAEAKHAAQVTEQQRKAHGSQKSKKDKGKERRDFKDTIPFLSMDRILLVGEGNFSFTRALVQRAVPSARGVSSLAPRVPLSAGAITATAYDSEEQCYEKYPDAHEVVRELREKGVEVLFEVDATKLEKHPTLKGRTWDRVVWNFPHAGKGIADQDRNILTNQLLILGFLRSVQHLLAQGSIPVVAASRKRKSDDDDEEEEPVTQPDNEVEQAPTRGTVLITLRNVAPYTLWDVPKLAKKPQEPTSANAPRNPRYTQLRSFAFDRSAWPGYAHRMTKGERAGGVGTTGLGGEDRMWEFCLAD